MTTWRAALIPRALLLLLPPLLSLLALALASASGSLLLRPLCRTVRAAALCASAGAGDGSPVIPRRVGRLVALGSSRSRSPR